MSFGASWQPLRTADGSTKPERATRQLELQGAGLIATVDAEGTLQRPAAFATLLTVRRTALPLIRTVSFRRSTRVNVRVSGWHCDATGTLGWRDVAVRCCGSHRSSRSLIDS